MRESINSESQVGTKEGEMLHLQFVNKNVIKIDICAVFFHHWVCVYADSWCTRMERSGVIMDTIMGIVFMQKHIDGIEETNILGKAKKKKRRSSVRILELQVGRSVAHKMRFACKWEQRIFLMYIA